MKKVLYILGGIAIAAGGSWAIYRYVIVPKRRFSFENIDWLNKTVAYSHPIGSGTTTYSALKSSGSQGQTSGLWNVVIEPGDEKITFTLKRNNKVTDIQIVDFKNQKVISN